MPSAGATCSIVNPANRRSLTRRRRLGIGLRQTDDCVIQVEQVIGRRLVFKDRLQVQSLAPATATTLQPLTVACPIDEDAAQRRCGRREELAAVFPGRALR